MMNQDLELIKWAKSLINQEIYKRKTINMRIRLFQQHNKSKD